MSPKAPGSTLRGAISDTSKLYQRYSNGAFTRGEMASALGMSSGSGSFFGKAATLKEYGLIDETAGDVRVSDLFKGLYQAPAGSAELKRHAYEAIRRPSAFARLLQQFSTKIPDEAALALRLETQERFNRDRAVAVAAAFRRSLGEYGLIDDNGNLLPVRDEATPGAAASAGASIEAVEPDDSDGVVGGGRQRLEVALSDGRKAILILPDDVTLADTRKIGALLTALAAEYDSD